MQQPATRAHKLSCVVAPCACCCAMSCLFHLQQCATTCNNVHNNLQTSHTNLQHPLDDTVLPGVLEGFLTCLKTFKTDILLCLNTRLPTTMHDSPNRLNSSDPEVNI